MHPAESDNCLFDQLDGTRISTNQRDLSNSRKMSMSPYLSPTSKLSSALVHSQGLLGAGSPLRRQMSNKSSLSLAGGAFFLKKFFFSFVFRLFSIELFRRNGVLGSILFIISIYQSFSTLIYLKSSFRIFNLLISN